MKRSVKKRFTEKAVLLLAALQLMLLTACGEAESIENDEGMPSMTVKPSINYIETEPVTTRTVTTTEPPETTPDRTGTELATTYTDENGNIYGIEPELPTVVSEEESTDTLSETTETTVDLSDFPTIELSDYYGNTDPANTYTTKEIPETVYETSSESSVTTVSETVTSSETATVSSETEAEAEEEEITAWDSIEETNARRIEARNAEIPSKYTDKNQIMHTVSYDSLTENQKYCYDVIVDAMLNYEKFVEFPLTQKITFDDLFAAYQCVYTDEVRLYYIDVLMEYITDSSTDYITYMKLSYTYSESKHEKMQQELDKRADEILSKITPDMSDYDIVKYFHDTIISNCEYTLTGTNVTSVYGALVEKKAQCQGYTRAFAYLCSLCGIETDMVLGIASEEHMWNMVKLDGDWYHIDLTWDDPDKADFPDSIRYDYFCLSTERMEELRTIEGNNHELPEAVADEYEYFIKNDYVADSYEDAKDIIISQAYEISKTKASTIQFRCADEGVFEEVYAALFSEDSVDNALVILDEANEFVENSFDTSSVSHNSNVNTLVIKLFLTYEE